MRKFRIFVESLLKQTERLPQILFATFVREVEALQIKSVGLRAALFVGGKRNTELDLERVDNEASAFILQRKYTLQLTFVSSRPKMTGVARVNQLRGTTSAIALSWHTC